LIHAVASPYASGRLAVGPAVFVIVIVPLVSAADRVEALVRTDTQERQWLPLSSSQERCLGRGGCKKQKGLIVAPLAALSTIPARRQQQQRRTVVVAPNRLKHLPLVGLEDR